MVRAKQGGGYGANGEFYKGGQFINTVPETVGIMILTDNKGGVMRDAITEAAVSSAKIGRAVTCVVNGSEQHLRSVSQAVGVDTEVWDNGKGFDFCGEMDGVEFLVDVRLASEPATQRG